MSKSLGGSTLIARNTGTFAAPVYPALQAARDLKLNLGPGASFDSSDRSANVDTVIPVRFKIAPSFTALWDGSAGLAAFRTAFIAGTGIDVVVGSGTGAADLIVHAIWAVTKFALKFPLADGQPLDIELQPHGNYGTTPPVFVNAGVTITGADAPGTKKTGTTASMSDSGAVALPVEDLSFTIEPGASFDSSDRSILFDTVIPTRFKYSAEGGFLWDPANTQFQNMLAAAEGNTAIEYYILDGPKGTTGSWGVHSSWAVTQFNVEGPLVAGVPVKFQLQPFGGGAVAPVLYTNP